MLKKTYKVLKTIATVAALIPVSPILFLYSLFAGDHNEQVIWRSVAAIGCLTLIIILLVKYLTPSIAWFWVYGALSMVMGAFAALFPIKKENNNS